MDYEDNSAETEHPNPKTHKGDDDDSATSEDEFVAAEHDPTLIQNLISSANESNARAEEMEHIAKVQANNVRLLACALRSWYS